MRDQCVLLAIFPTYDVLALRDVINYALKRVRPAELPFNSKYRWGARARKRVAMTPRDVTDNVTLQPSVLYYKRVASADRGSRRNGLASPARWPMALARGEA